MIRRHVPRGSVFTTALLPIFMMGWSTHSKITGDDKHGGQGLISWDMEQPFRGTSSHGKMEGQAPHGVQQVLHPVLKHPDHHCKLRAAGWKAAPWKRCWKSCQAMTCTTGTVHQALPARARNGVLGCVSKSKIRLVLKTLLSMSLFRGFENHIPYKT